MIFHFIESCHKVLRFASKYLARQHNNLKNAEDVFNHLWFISDPLVRSESGEFEEKENSELESNEIKDNDDIIVESFFVENVE